MGHGVSGGGRPIPAKETVEKLKHSITLTDVVVKERTIYVDVPKINYKEETRTTTIYRPVEQDTIKYNTKVLDTIKYRPVEKETIVYRPKDKVYEKPVIVEKVYEKPILIEKEYEKPIIKEKVIEVVKISDLETVQSLIGVVKELAAELTELKRNLDTMRNYKLIEKVIQVPKLEWKKTEVERIEWIDVKREMPLNG